MGGDECSDFKNPIGRPAKAGFSGNGIFTETGKSWLSVPPSFQSKPIPLILLSLVGPGILLCLEIFL